MGVSSPQSQLVSCSIMFLMFHEGRIPPAGGGRLLSGGQPEIASVPVDHVHQAQSQTCIPTNWTELIDLIRFIFSAKLNELIQSLFRVSWLATESIRFHKVGDWVDWLWGTGMIKWIDLTKNIPKQGQWNRRFSKNDQQIHWINWLIESLIHCFDLIGSIHMYLLSSMIEFIGIFKLYRFIVIESIRFHIFHDWIDLAWVVYRSARST